MQRRPDAGSFSDVLAYKIDGAYSTRLAVSANTSGMPHLQKTKHAIKNQKVRHTWGSV